MHDALSALRGNFASEATYHWGEMNDLAAIDRQIKNIVGWCFSSNEERGLKAGESISLSNAAGLVIHEMLLSRNVEPVDRSDNCGDVEVFPLGRAELVVRAPRNESQSLEYVLVGK